MNNDSVLEEVCGYLSPKKDKIQRKFRGAQSIQ